MDFMFWWTEKRTESAIINYDRLKWLGVSEEQLKQDAWENMKQSNPPCFLDLQDMLAKMCFDESGDVKAGSLEHLEGCGSQCNDVCFDEFKSGQWGGLYV